jgi:hypothetical protein
MRCMHASSHRHMQAQALRRRFLFSSVPQTCLIAFKPCLAAVGRHPLCPSPPNPVRTENAFLEFLPTVGLW